MSKVKQYKMNKNGQHILYSSEIWQLQDILRSTWNLAVIIIYMFYSVCSCDEHQI